MMVGLVTYPIGKAARASELSVKAIRYYEEIGLIPKAGRTNSGTHTSDHRHYTAADIGWLRFIHRARLLGLALADIRQILAVAEARGCPSRQPEYQQMLKNHLHEIDQRIGHLRALRMAIADLTAPGPRTGDAGCTWDSCGCLQPRQRVPSSAVSPSATARKQGAQHV